MPSLYIVWIMKVLVGVCSIWVAVKAVDVAVKAVDLAGKAAVDLAGKAVDLAGKAVDLAGKAVDFAADAVAWRLIAYMGEIIENMLSEKLLRFKKVGWTIIFILKFIGWSLCLLCMWMCQDTTNVFLSSIYYTSAGFALYFSAVFLKDMYHFSHYFAH